MRVKVCVGLVKMKIKKEEFDDDKCSVLFPLVSISKTKEFVSL